MRKVESIEVLKGRLGNELGRLQERRRKSMDALEGESLWGSILTVQKIMEWLK